MLFSIAVTLLVLSFFASIVLTGFFRNVARANNILIDIPNKSRKFHFRPTPLIGGVSIHTAMLLSSVLMLFLIDFKNCFGMIASVSIFARSKGVAMELKEVNFFMTLLLKNVLQLHSLLQLLGLQDE